MLYEVITHQAIALSKDEKIRIPSIIEDNCVGCNLCSLVCPVQGCITMVKKDDGKQHVTWDERTQNNDIPITFEDERAGGKHHYVPKPSEALKFKK